MPLVINTAIPTSVPVRTDLASRRLLHTRLQNADNHPVVVAAPGGFGKTSLAVQHASHHSHVLWFDGSAAPCRTDDLLETVVELLLDRLPSDVETSRRRSIDDLFSVAGLGVLAGALLVVDDHGSHPEADDSSDSLIAAFAPLSAAGLHILITTSTDRSEHPGIRGNVVHLSTGDLIVGVDERDEWGGLPGGMCEGASLRTAHSQAHGIPALFATSLACGGWGAESVRRSVEILAEWLSSSGATPTLRTTAMCMLLLGRGTFRDLSEAGLKVEVDDLEALHRGFPLLGIDRRRSSFSAVAVPVSTTGIPFHEIESMSPGTLERVAEMLARLGSVERASEVYFSLSSEKTVGPWLARWGAQLVELGALPLIEGAVNRLSSSEQVSDGALLLLRGLSALLEEGPVATRPLAMAAALTGAADPSLVRRALVLRLVMATEAGDEDEMRSMMCELTLAGDASGGHPSGSTDESAAIARAKALLGSVGEALGLIHGAIEGEGDPGGRSDGRTSLAFAEIDRVVSGGTNIAQVHAARSAATPEETVCSALAEAELGYSKALALRSDQARGHSQRCITFLRGSGLDSLADCVGFIQGMCDAADGNQEQALEAMELSIATAIGRGERLRANEMRILHSMALRAFGRTAEALVCAECAVEYFSTRSCVQHRVAASLELAAAMAALFDFEGACSCLESGVLSGELPEYLGYRRALIIAACRISTSGRAAAVPPLHAYAASSLHESNGWVLQMYRRAFPALGDLLDSIRRGDATLLGDGQTVSSESTVDGPPAVLVVPEGAIKVRMFGGFDLQMGSLTIQDNDWHKRKSRSLFAALVICRGKDISREVLFERFWPDMDIDRARDNFYVTWSNMKRTLALAGEPGLFVKNRNGICRVDSHWVVSDVDEFEAITSQVVMRDAKTQQREILELYRRLQYIYRGELLGGNLYDDWFSRSRVVYHDAFLEAMSHASGIALSIGDTPLALWFARKAMECDATREEIYCALMKAQIAANQRSSALETFHRCRTYLCDELGLDPSAETMDLYNDLLMMDASVRYGVPRNHHGTVEDR